MMEDHQNDNNTTVNGVATEENAWDNFCKILKLKKGDINALNSEIFKSPMDWHRFYQYLWKVDA